METKKPIKRHESLRPLSREHHHGLLLCWKIREGLKKGSAPERIKAYTDWFWENHLAGHFEEEEKHVFPLLDQEHPLVKRALSEHRRLARLFQDNENIVQALNRIEDELSKHIRFEERVLFQEIQERASQAELDRIEAIHGEFPDIDEWHDAFWK